MKSNERISLSDALIKTAEAAAIFTFHLSIKLHFSLLFISKSKQAQTANEWKSLLLFQFSAAAAAAVYCSIAITRSKSFEN